MNDSYSPMTYVLLGILALVTFIVVATCGGLWGMVLWQKSVDSSAAVLILPTPTYIVSESQRPESPSLEVTAMPLPNPPTSMPQGDNSSSGQTETLPSRDSVSSSDIPDLEILSQKTMIDERGRHHIVGEVRNNSKFPAKYVSIVAEYYDEEDKLQGANLTFTDPNFLNPGEVRPFDMVILRRTHWAENHSYQLSVKGYPTEKSTQQAVILLSQSSRLDNGFLYVTGEVKNSGSDWMLVKVVVTLYDAHDQVINTKWDYIQKAMLAPDAQAPFEVKLEHQTDPNDYHYRVQIEEDAVSPPGVVDTPTP